MLCFDSPCDLILSLFKNRNLWLLSFFWLITQAAVAGVDIFIIRPDNNHFLNAKDGIVQDLGPGFDYHEMIMPSALGQEGYHLLKEELAEKLRKVKPKLIVLMNNKSTHLYRLYQKEKGHAVFPPAVVLMSVYADREIGSLTNAAGIGYEIQGVTSLVNLRSLVTHPVKRIGVLYSPELKHFFVKQRNSCRTEEFELIGTLVDEKPIRMRKTIKQGLKSLINDKKVDAVWVLNDNRLLTPKLLRSAWAPVLRKSSVPVIVGIRWMVLDSAGIGSFAVVPDHFSLGQQAAGLILDIQDNDWVIESSRPIHPHSVHKILNAGKLKGIGLNRAALLELDLLIEH